MNKLSFLMVAFTAAFVLACGGPPDARFVQAKKAREAANSISFTENVEIDNIKRRLELTSNPGQMGYVLLMNEAGQPVLYTTVVGKITSSGKRLQDRNCANGHECPSDEGTYGSSDPYIYFWSQSGMYHQWNGPYLYSDKPLRLEIKPLVVEVVSGVEQ